MTALMPIVITAAAVAAGCWIASLISGDHSWVDRIWSIAPVAYAFIVLGTHGWSDPRLWVVTVLITLWGARLTFNFARKGGYTGTEDYRWAILRGRMPRWAFELFNVFFIVLYQNTLIVLITLPLLTMADAGTPLTWIDILLAAAFLACLAGEFIADQQQWNFHAWKREQQAAGRDPAPGFLTSGLWRMSRHPNYFFEQAQWWIVYLFAVAATGSVLHWTVLGPVLLTLLFIGSTIFTESITGSKYPDYADYQRRTSMLVPWPPRRPAPHTAP